MSQTPLFQSEKVVKCKCVANNGGFDVLNPDDFKEEGIQRVIHIPHESINKDREEGFKIGMSKEQFEEYVKKCYNVKKVEWVNSLEDKEGEFVLNGVLIKYKFEARYSGTDMAHFDFRSETPNLISETGYRSEFLEKGQLEYESVEKLIERYCLDRCKIKPVFTLFAKSKEPKSEPLALNNGFDFDIMREDLRDWIFVGEDTEEGRYREKIIDKIKEFGVKKWFEARGYPTNPESIWKNRYCGTTETLKEDLTKFNKQIDVSFDELIEQKGYYTWENSLPENMWNDKEMFEEYKVGTKEYLARKEQEEKDAKKYNKKPKSQKPLFEEDEDEEDEDLDGEEEFEPSENYGNSKTTIEQIKKESICPIIVCEEVDGEIKEVKEEMTSTFSVKSNGLVFDSLLYEERIGNCWGSGHLTEKDAMDKLLGFYKQILSKPYSEVDTPFTTNQKIENCKVTFTKEAKDWLISKGFDFSKFEEEEKKLRGSQQITTPELLAKAKTFELMEKSMDKLRKECWAIRAYFESFLDAKDLCGKRKSAIAKLIDLQIDYLDLNKLRDVYESKAKIFKLYYQKVHFMRWGTDGVEYSDV